jgi:60 kDa SS-A/Ro ribonucleoprotein
MARTNLKMKSAPIFTHEGAQAERVTNELQLRRSVMSCMLFEDEFYEDGKTISDRIGQLIAKVDPQKVFDIAIEARENMKLRHIPLLLAREMARLPHHKGLVRYLLPRIIKRADELAEFLAIYWKEKRQPLSAQVKKGLAEAFLKFDEYALAKYNRDNAIKLKDVLFLTHVDPEWKGDYQVAPAINKAKYKRGAVLRHTTGKGALLKRLIDGTLAVPYTWEVELSASKGNDKKAVWERLLNENALGGLALIRNLRNMQETGVDEKLIFEALKTMKTEWILPFRFIAAARYAPQWEDRLEEPMLKCLAGRPKLEGKTALLLDVSGSMDAPVSGKSKINRMDAAAALGVLLREICEQVTIITFSDAAVKVPPRRGFALRDGIVQSQRHSGTDGNRALKMANSEGYDRIIIITDEQWISRADAPLTNEAYFINVASYQNGISYSKYVHIDGFSEAVIDYIYEYEKFAKRTILDL